MSIFNSMNISASGLSAERVRVNAAASNLANANTTRTAQGGPYQRIDPILQSVDDDDGAGVKVAGLQQDTSGGRPMYMPDHPDADADGMVMMPNVDPINEVVNLVSAQRGFEANATAFETAKTLIDRALELIR